MITINELIFQGAFDVSKPMKLALTEGINEFSFPPGLHIDDVHALFVSLLYPQWLTAEQRSRVEMGHTVKLAISFEQEGRSFRILRRESDDSMRLQMKDAGKYRDVASGVQIEELLIKQLKFPPYAIFKALALWRYDENLPSDDPVFSLDQLDPSARDLISKYQLALDMERLEDETKAVEGRIGEIEKLLGESGKIEDNLEKARQKYEAIKIVGLEDEDIELLRYRDERLDEFARQIDRLELEEEDANHQIEQLLPERPWKKPVFGVGIAIVLLATLGSIAQMETMRPIALANVLGLTLVAYALLHYFTGLERASVHLVRLDSIKRRLGQVRDDQVSYQDRLNHLLNHTGANNEDELLERDMKTAKLSEIIAKLERQLERERTKPVYQESMRELDELEEDLVRLQAERDELPPSILGSYQLESDLKSLGIDPAAALAAQDGPKEQPYDKDVFTRLFEVARRTGQISGGELTSKTRKMWSKIAGHVLGKRFAEVNLVDPGALRIGTLTPEQIEMWQGTRTTEVKLLAAALALSMQVSMPSRYGQLQLLVIDEPIELFPGEFARKFNAVFKSAAKRTQILISELTY